VVGRLRHLDDAADVDDGLALGDQLLGGLELADDLLRRVPGAFYGRVPGPVWPDEDSHLPWTELRGPRHTQCHTEGFCRCSKALAKLGCIVIFQGVPRDQLGQLDPAIVI